MVWDAAHFAVRIVGVTEGERRGIRPRCLAADGIEIGAVGYFGAVGGLFGLASWVW